MQRIHAQAAPIHTLDVNKLALFTLVSLAVYLMAVTAVYAGVSSPMGAVMCDIVYIIYGNLGRGLAIIAVAVVGAGATLGKVTWGLALTVGVGIGVLFGAGSIATYFITSASDLSGTGC